MSKRAKKILIVDDLEAWLHSIAEILEDIDCSLDFAKNYIEAQTKLKSDYFDLCIIDIRLEEKVDYNVAGIDLLEWIYRDQHGKPPVIILTGHATPALRQKADWYGAFAFLEKSYETMDFDFDRELFLRTVKEVIK